MKFLILLYPLFFLLVFFFEKDKQNHKLYNVILLIYFLAGVSSVYIYNYIDSYRNLPIGLLAICYQLSALYLLIKPLERYDGRATMSLLKPNTVVYFFTAFVIVIVSIYFINGAQNVRMSRIMDDVSGLRMELVQQENTRSFLGYIAFIAKQLSVAPIAMMFYYMVMKPEKKLLILVLFVLSLSFPIVELQFAAREYLIKYLFVVFCFYMCTKDKLSPKWRKNVKLYGLLTAIPIVIVFFLITFLRFGEYDKLNVSNSILGYFGQGYVYFTEAFETFPNGMFEEKGSLCFPFFSSNGRLAYNMSDQVNTTIHLNVFRTTVGTWLQDCGWALTIIIVLFFYLLFRYIGRLRYHNVFTLIYMGWVFDFIFQALFFFHSIITGTSIVVYLFVIFLDYCSRNGVPSRKPKYLYY